MIVGWHGAALLARSAWLNLGVRIQLFCRTVQRIRHGAVAHRARIFFLARGDQLAQVEGMLGVGGAGVHVLRARRCGARGLFLGRRRAARVVGLPAASRPFDLVPPVSCASSSRRFSAASCLISHGWVGGGRRSKRWVGASRAGREAALRANAPAGAAAPPAPRRTAPSGQVRVDAEGFRADTAVVPVVQHQRLDTVEQQLLDFASAGGSGPPPPVSEALLHQHVANVAPARERLAERHAQAFHADPAAGGADGAELHRVEQPHRDQALRVGGVARAAERRVLREPDVSLAAPVRLRATGCARRASCPAARRSVAPGAACAC